MNKQELFHSTDIEMGKIIFIQPMILKSEQLFQEKKENISECKAKYELIVLSFTLQILLL